MPYAQVVHLGTRASLVREDIATAPIVFLDAGWLEYRESN